MCSLLIRRSGPEVGLSTETGPETPGREFGDCVWSPGPPGSSTTEPDDRRQDHSSVCPQSLNTIPEDLISVVERRGGH